MKPDPRIEMAIKAILDDVERGIVPSVVIARGAERLMALVADEMPSERKRRKYAEARLEMIRLGDGPNAAEIVAHRRTNNPHDQAIFAQHLRRLRRAERKTNNARSTSKQAGTLK